MEVVHFLSGLKVRVWACSAVCAQILCSFDVPSILEIYSWIIDSSEHFAPIAACGGYGGPQGRNSWGGWSTCGCNSRGGRHISN